MSSILPNFLLDFFLIFFPVFFITRDKTKRQFKKILQLLGIEKPGAKFFFKKTIALLATLIIVSIAVSIALALIGIRDMQGVFETINSIKTQNIALLFYLLIVRVIAEEIFFRG
jgi:membrane protease YdiL (CAAX protease family)